MKVSWESVEPGAHSLRLLRLQLAAFAAPMHAHEAIELTWVQRGQGLRFVGGSVEPFGDGDLVLLGPRLPHTWHSRGEQHGPVSATVLQLRPPLALEGLPEWRQTWGALARWAEQGLVVQDPALRETLCAQLQALPAQPGLPQLGGALALLGLLGAATAQAQQLRPLNPAPPRPRDTPQQQHRLDALLAWVRQHLAAELRTADAAALLHVSPAAFGRSFQRQVGKPFSQYVNDLRISEACLALRQTERPVAEVAQHCGFATLSHFNAQFKARLGVTPRGYRGRG